MAEVVGSLIDHETAALHPDGVAAVEVGVKVGTVAHALMMPTLEISVFVEYDLKKKVEKYQFSSSHLVLKNEFTAHFQQKYGLSLPFPLLDWWGPD